MIWLDLSNLVLTVYSIILITGLPGNLMSLYAFIQKVKQEAKQTDMLLLSLNISDLMFLFFLPIGIIEAADLEWNMNSFLCPLLTYIFLLNIYNSTLLLTAVSVDRYLGVAFAINYKLKQHPRYAVIISVIIWVFNLVQCSIVYYMQYHFSDEKQVGLDPTTHNTCYWKFNEEQLKIILPKRLGVSIVAIFVPLIICCFCYINIIRILYQLDNISWTKRFRAIGLAISTLLLFMICFVPFGVYHVVGFIGWYSPEWRDYALLFSSISVCLDPFVFYFSSKALQYTFRDCTQGLLMWLQLHCKQFVTNNSSGQTQQEIEN